ncbi:FixH family protein [Saccharospirillum impatiens]|uniref:FixH family protein n=1 Tax=Saccharospirillum impatiens TaxID=169438 RepID=UPI0003F73CB4|nr:FixH family protein [Saccharospirillum impatiens]
MNQTAITPWYRQFWPWLVFSPMLFVVPAGIWMIYISVVTSDGSVIDDVYKDGRSYIVSTEADDLAIELQLQAQMQMIGDRISLRLDGNLESWPETLVLLFVFDAHAQRDVEITLNRTPGGRYTGLLTESIEGQRSLLLQPSDSKANWRLHGNVTLPSSTIQTLQPRVR